MTTLPEEHLDTPMPTIRKEIVAHGLHERKLEAAISDMERGLTNYQSEFRIGDHVVIDRDKSMICVVIAVCFYLGKTDILTAWLHNGESRSAWIEDWRLTKVEE